MTWPDALNVALKEWASVCAALEQGRQILLLRKGGIYESAGEFEIEHRQFLLFPTFLHQNLKMLKPSEHAGFVPMSAEPAQITISVAGVITDIVQLQSRRQMEAIDEHHIWTPPLIDMRFNYRPENPLYLLLVRAWRLPRPAALENTVEYAGCKSWVPLEQEISTTGATPTLSDPDYEARRQSILDKIHPMELGMH